MSKGGEYFGVVRVIGHIVVSSSPVTLGLCNSAVCCIFGTKHGASGFNGKPSSVSI